jgi:thiamine-phosphate diphosphorylase
MIRAAVTEFSGVYAIYDHPHPYVTDAAAVVRRLVAGGAGQVQLRAKGATTGERIDLGRVLGRVCLDHGAGFWLNDDTKAALELGELVTGVHLGQADLRLLDAGGRQRLVRGGCGLGISTHDLQQVEAALAFDPDYLGFGPVFPTSSKKDPDPTVGLQGLAAACSISSVPVVAIGGIDLQRAASCLPAGASAVAVISALVDDRLEGIEAKTRILVRACSAALAPPSPGAIEEPG